MKRRGVGHVARPRGGSSRTPRTPSCRGRACTRYSVLAGENEKSMEVIFGAVEEMLSFSQRIEETVHSLNDMNESKRRRGHGDRDVDEGSHDPGRRGR